MHELKREEKSLKFFIAWPSVLDVGRQGAAGETV